jgi:hypothetical protein
MNPLQLWVHVVISTVEYSASYRLFFIMLIKQEGTAEAPDHLVKCTARNFTPVSLV